MNNDVVILQLDRLRQIKFTNTAMKTLVKLTGKPIDEIGSELIPDNFEIMEQAFFCGLLFDAKENGETLTMEKAVDLFDTAPVYFDVLKAIFEAWNIACGGSSKEGNQQPAKQPAKKESSTGKKVSE
ncbi:hypothetical protein [Paenibacillus ginsengarvi]|uniref:Uncharacterized protein n=1 Tax=Paenibacillus ginsengarvi TaxID=400777 RepID=A0A3B0CNN8_9BACL|nr:hypothetical protein [Paenibacillus ginsengarvi]RKN86742.1 hypothetical protein D7M11_01940 [Paenibacillus ginsengarvi]